MAQAGIFHVKDTITLQWVAVDSVDMTTSTEDKAKQAQKSSVPARGLGILPQVKIEKIDSENEQEDEKAPSAPIQGTPGRSSSKREREQSASASDPVRDHLTARSKEIESLKAQVSELTAMLKQQKLPDGYLTATRKEQITGTRGTREAWVAEAMILDAANRVKMWKHPITGALEDSAKYRRRMIINVAIKESLKKYPEFYYNELEGDNYTIVRNVIMFGEPSSKFMKVTLDKKLTSLVKTSDKTYQEYESELREIWDELACIGRHFSDEDKTLKLIAGMENDRRYKQVVKDVCNSDSNYQQCHIAFMQEANAQNDLWREQKKNPRQRSTHGDVNSATEQNQHSNNSRTRGRGGRGGRGGIRRALRRDGLFLLGELPEDVRQGREGVAERLQPGVALRQTMDVVVVRLGGLQQGLGLVRCSRTPHACRLGQ